MYVHHRWCIAFPTYIVNDSTPLSKGGSRVQIYSDRGVVSKPSTPIHHFSEFGPQYLHQKQITIHLIITYLSEPIMVPKFDSPPSTPNSFSQPRPRAPRSPGHLARIRVQNRRRAYLDRHAEYFQSSEHELAGKTHHIHDTFYGLFPPFLVIFLSWGRVRKGMNHYTLIFAFESRDRFCKPD